ncbi:hypothetical protein [Actinoplanes philippinensis]|uniref:hypothetical protein n=1 Tax=Actinoplanes philippinensis TaxID=35752 RepID=UPI000B889E72|nr:hypothetical protein [Actinoplanes philippinensis]
MPHQRASEHRYPDGPTEPLGTARDGPAPESRPREGAAPDPPAALIPRAATPPPIVVADPEPAVAPRPRRRRAGIVAAILLSLLALLASGAGVWLSWRAYQATRAPEPAFRAAPVIASVAARPPQPARYPVAYAKEPLRLQVACAAVLHLDLDEPRADAAEVLADLRYDGGCGTKPPQLGLGVGAAGGSRQVSADADAADCDRAIRTAPLGRGLAVEVKEGTAVCVLTAAAPAQLVLVEIIDVGGSGTAGLRATSWQVPGDR